LDDGLGPLGPLGENAPTPELGPTPPVKEQTLPIRAGNQSRAAGAPRPDHEDESVPGSRVRGPPPVQPISSVAGENVRRQGQPSMSVEQAAKPSFDITVGDPHKVGDLTNSHIVYSVRTKVHLLQLLRPYLTSIDDF
jgi:sorting nexin-1/2